MRSQPALRRAARTRAAAALFAVSSAVAMLASPVAAQLPPPTTTTTAAPAGPTISSIWLATGPVGGSNAVFVIGSGLSAATAVRFGANPAISFTVDSNERITAIAPPASTPAAPYAAVAVVVDTPSGSSTPTPESTYFYWAAPRIVATAPAPLTSSKDGGQEVTLSVEDLGSWPRGVYVDGTNVGWSYDELHAGNVRFTTWPHAIGTVEVVVEGAGGPSAPVVLTYLDTPVPKVDAIVPDHGPIEGGTVVVLTGSAFTGATSVAFAPFSYGPPVPAESFTVDSDTQITLVTPSVAEFNNKAVQVTTPAGVTYWWTEVSFRFDGPPVLQAAVPANGPLAGATPVYLHGRGLDRVTNVLFGEVPAASFQLTNNQIVAIAPPHAAGTVNLTLDSDQGRSHETMPFEFTSSGPPTVHAVAPDHGPQHGGTTVVVTGSGFATATAVNFGWEAGPATFTIDSDTQITATSPAAPNDVTVFIAVTNAIGESIAVPSGSFTYRPTPSLWSVTPGGGTTAGGTAIEIGGVGTDIATAVRIGDVPVPFTYDADRGVLRAVTPPHAAGPVPVVIDDENGTSSTTADWGNTFIYERPGVPIATGAGPAFGTDYGGTTVTIWGVDLQYTTGVRFGSTPATSFAISTEWMVTTITAVTPPHPDGVVEVTLESVAGDSMPGPNTRFEFSPQPPPSLGMVIPSEGPVEGGSVVELYGANLTQATAVTFGGVPALSFSVPNDYTIRAVVPPANDQTQDSLVHVVVTTPVGVTDSGWMSSLYGYRVNLVPEVRALSSTRGSIAGGGSVSIYGAGFTGATSVRFGTHEASFSVFNDGRIEATAPAVEAPYLYDVTVTTPRGANPSTPTSWYLYRSQPAVWSVEANTGSVLGGDTVTIKGDQFTDAWSVSFGWNAATYRVIDQHTIVATVPACAAGTVWVTVQSPEGTSEVDLGSLYTYRTPGAPVVTSTTANRGSTAGGQTVVLIGSGFTGTTGVRFEDTPATSFTVDSDAQITAVVPPRAAPALVNISVDTPHGTNPNAPLSWFLYQSP